MFVEGKVFFSQDASLAEYGYLGRELFHEVCPWPSGCTQERNLFFTICILSRVRVLSRETFFFTRCVLSRVRVVERETLFHKVHP